MKSNYVELESLKPPPPTNKHYRQRMCIVGS
jgi:hypothetical protein